MEITTKFNLGSRAVRFFDGAIQALEIIAVEYRLVKANESEGGEITYSAIRKDSAYNPHSPFEKPWISFKETEVGKSIFLDKEELLARVAELPVDDGIKRP